MDMTFEDRRKVFIRAVDLPDQVGRFMVEWRDELPSTVDLDAVRSDLFRLLNGSADSLKWPDSIIYNLEDYPAEYPVLASVAKQVLIMPASSMAAEMKRIARDYEREGGRLLSPEEVERVIAERRGAA
jgi:hypothetical protein